MTIAEIKLEDAKTQLDLVRKYIDDEKIVRSCVSAFFAHARSIDEVLDKDSHINPPLKAWSDGRLHEFRGMPITKFIRRSRNHSIHRGTLPLDSKRGLRNLNVLTPDGRRIFGPPTTSLWLLDGAEAEGVQPYVVALCLEYLELVSQLVADWKAERARLCL